MLCTNWIFKRKFPCYTYYGKISILNTVKKNIEKNKEKNIWHMKNK